MRSAKSIQSLNSQQSMQKPQTNGGQHVDLPKNNNSINNQTSNSSPTSPICRCRVMYLGSSVPHITKDGLQGIQEPLRELYPDEASLSSGNAGIDSWLSVWSNGILIENVDETGREVKRFFKIDALHYCAAVKFVSLPLNQQQQQVNGSYTISPIGNPNQLPKFLPLDSPHARQANSNPPIFASILRRTTGVKVLECHAFICKREAAANALVRCCFHAYADTIYAKQIGADVNGISHDINNNINNNNNNNNRHLESQTQNEIKLHDQALMYKNDGRPPITTKRSKSIANLNDAEQTRMDAWRSSDSSSYSNQVNHDEFHIACSQRDHNSIIRRKSTNEHYALNCDNTDNSRLDKQQQQQQLHNDNLRKQNKFSKSMHHLNQNGQIYGMNFNHTVRDQASDLDGFGSNQSSSASCINLPNNRWQQQQDPRLMQQQVPHPPFYNPYSGRVPSYPPQNLIDSANNGGTLRSIKSMAANSIASTLLRSKKHAKAMSMAQLNQDKITSFHQHHSNASTMVGPILMPPIPPMFLPNLPPRIINGSQTMKVPNRNMLPPVNQPMNFEAMTPKEMKKLLKKSAKYGIDQNKFGDNGLPILPLRPLPIPQTCPIPQTAGTPMACPQPVFQDIYGGDIYGSEIGPPQGFSRGGSMINNYTLDPHQLKPILVKPNAEFLKSKVGKKWLKQQKEFKKLLPPHLDGLPIIFGPPPVEALEPAGLPENGIPAPKFVPSQPPIPMMDSSGYYNPHPFYGQTGRASAASTLLRYSPHSHIMHENSNGLNGPQNDSECAQRSHPMYSSSMVGHPPIIPNQAAYMGGDDSSMIFGHPDCGLDTHGRQYVDNNQLIHKRNHMVEQSVISLGDENDYDDDDDNEVEGRHGNHYSSASHSSEVARNSRRSSGQQPGGSKSKNRERSVEHIMENQYQDKDVYNQQDYEQPIQPSDDQGSYSSGIYKKGHINERAFSYSIRQEHKSSAGSNSNCDYIMRNEIMAEDEHERGANHDNQQNRGNIYQHDQNEEYYRNNHRSQTIPVNELTARLENQLNMKSFANSRVKSQI